MSRRLLVTGVCLLSLVTGCSSGPLETALAGSSTTGSPSTSASATAAAADDVRKEITAALRARAAAVREKDRRAFAAGLAPGAGRASQLAAFDRLAQLPVASVAYELGNQDLGASSAHRYVGTVTELVGLRRFDRRPVATSHRMVLTRKDASGPWQVESDKPDRVEMTQAPWAQPESRFVVGRNVLIVSDQKALPQSTARLADAEQAWREVDAFVPGGLDPVVVFAFSDFTVFESEGFSQRTLDRIGGSVVPTRGAGWTRVGSRVLVAPGWLTESAPFRGVVLRHELAHVAQLDGRPHLPVPHWVVEGLAEYVAWHGQSPLLGKSVVRAARAGKFKAMPANGDFYFEDWPMNYGVAWWAMEWLAGKHGERAPFELMEALIAAEADDGESADAVLEKKYGLTADELARRAAELIDEVFEA